MPTASALEAEHQQAQQAQQLQQNAPKQVTAAGGKDYKPVDSRASKPDQAALEKDAKQNYAGALDQQQSKNEPAADFKPTGPSPIPGLAVNAPKEAAVPSETLAAKPEDKDKTYKTGEITEERTATSETFRNKDGTYTTRHYQTPKYFKKSGEWQKVDTGLVEDKNAGDSGNIFGKVLGNAESWVTATDTYTIKDNEWQARFAPSDAEQGMVRIKKGDSQIGFSPVNANQVKPVITTAKNGDQTVHYYNLWPGVDVEYAVLSAELKENIVIKNKKSTSDFTFKLSGGSLESSKYKQQGLLYDITGALGDEFSIAPFSISLNKYGFEARQQLTQSFKNGELKIGVDKDYLASLPDDAFPAIVDPTTVTRSNFGTRAGGNYLALKSDGYVCYSNVCNPYAGSVQDSQGYWRVWRGIIFSDYSFVKGRQLNYARLHLTQRLGLSVSGVSGARNFSAWHATCSSYDCVGMYGNVSSIDTVGDINVTNIYQNRITAGDWGAWLMIRGEETTTTTYKNWDPDNSFVEFTYSDVIPAPTLITPTDGQVFTDPQVSFTSTTGTNPATGTALQYVFCVSTSPSCNGAVMVSSEQQSSQWTIPDGMLQDGTTYYVQVKGYDPSAQVYGSWGVPTSFRIDQRTGKDNTQAYDTLGPVNVDFATGNLSTSASSHSSSALGGSLGISLDYNSPVKSRNGLVGTYYNNNDFSGNPVLTRVDSQINLGWLTGSPASNVVNPDNFAARWQGYFVAPKTGSYRFGMNADDGCRVWINDVLILDQWTWCGNAPYSTTTHNFTAGQLVKIKIEYREIGGSAGASLRVKGTVDPNGMVVPSSWLQTGVRDATSKYGLTGRYYKDNGTHNFNDAANTMIMQRIDPAVSFDWAGGAAVPGGPSDNFMARWTGYITVPTTGSYELGTTSDDGSRITVGTGTPVFSKWSDDGGQTLDGSSFSFTAGVPTPITVDYFEHGGAARMYLNIKSASLGIGRQVVPGSWLSSAANVLPAGWNLGVDPDGNVSYDRIKVTQNSAILTDSTGSTHEYAWDPAKNGYKPPVNEDGTLTRNADATYTFQDTDGRTYVFNADGTINSVTNPVDDAHPAALQYVYGGTPSRLTQITDGVDSSRWAKVYYSGDANCTVAPATFDSSAPSGMLCAVKTDDGRTTSFFYRSGRLARIQEPGNALTDYQYDTLGRIVSVRDSLANDVIAAGGRADDATANTSISYDDLGRVINVTQPAATAGANRTQHTLEYSTAGTRRWTDTQPLNTQVVSGVSNVSWGSNRIDQFARGSANDLIHRWYENGKWSGWESLGGCIQNNPSATSWGPGRLDVFVEGCASTGNIYQKTYANGYWHDYVNIPGTTNESPAAISWGLGRIDLFVRDSGNGLAHLWFDSGSWSQWEGFGGCLGSAPAVSSRGYLKLDVFVRSCGNTLSWKSYDPATGWTAYADTAPTAISGGVSAASVDSSTIDLLSRNASGDVQMETYNASTGWGARQTVGICATDTPNLSVRPTGVINLFYKGCETTGNNLYQKQLIQPAGSTMQHMVGAAEPNGFNHRVEYDQLYRTLADTDIAGLTDLSEWEATKDLLLSTTDETGLKSTTIYDDEDRAVTQYGPAPAAWYGADRKPLSTYTSQVPRTDTAFDENMQGPSVTYYAYSTASKTLAGAPKLHTTNLSGAVSGDFNKVYTTSPVPGVSSNWGFRATGKLRLPATGTYHFRIASDNGARVYVDNKLQIDDWNDGALRSHPDFTIDNVGGSVHGITVEYYHTTGDATFTLYMTPPGGSEIFAGLNQYISPDYSLTTRTKTYDATLGDSTTTTNYGSNPELGLAQSTSVDPTGLNLTTTSTYEQQGATGSYLRQTAKFLPGANTSDVSTATRYAYYGATETRDNPCTTGTTEAYKQAGMLKLKTEPDPDGTGSQTGRTTETIYDDMGKVVATRYNSDDWTCTTYDARGRVTQTVIPTIGGEAGRTISNNYAVSGDPLETASWDNGGWIVTWTDLLGRTVKYRDIHDDETTSTYDNFGKLAQRVSPLGTETYIYDSFERLTEQRLDGVTYARVTYDQYGRVASVDYPDAAGQKLVLGRDALGRTNSQTYYKGVFANAGSNLVANSSAEAASTSDPTLAQNWQVGGWGTNTRTYSYLNEGHSGSRALKATITGYTDGDAKWYFDPVNVPASTSYTFRDYYKSNVTTSVVAQFTLSDGTTSYQWLGSPIAVSDWTQASYSFTTPANTTQVTILHLIASVGWVAVDDYELYPTSQAPSAPAVIASDTVTRSQSNQIVNDVVASGSNNLWYTYGYDNGDRITSANMGPHTYTYGYGTQNSATCGTGTGTNPNAGKSGNRTSQTIDGVTTYFCYDYADRLINSSDALYTPEEYDAHGNMTFIGNGAQPLRLCYDASDRNYCVIQRDNNGDAGTAIYYARDVQGRITYHEKDAIDHWNWNLQSYTFNGYTGSGDTPDFVRDSSWNIVEKTLELPGGVTVTIKPQQTGNASKNYNLPNIHGDVLLTTNAAGTNTSNGNGPANSFTYDPFGNVLAGSVLPANTVNGSYGYVGQHEKLTESALTLTPIQMGARVYLPTIGRFTQVDPIEGGVDNNYVYPTDPVNEFDLTGEFGWRTIGKIALSSMHVAEYVPGPIGMAATGAAVAVNLASGNWAGAAAEATGFIPLGKSVKVGKAALGHIIERHGAASLARGVGKFAEGTSRKELRQMIKAAGKHGVRRPNTNGHAGEIIEHNVGRIIGTNGSRRATSKIRVIVRGRRVITAFPY